MKRKTAQPKLIVPPKVIKAAPAGKWPGSVPQPKPTAKELAEMARRDKEAWTPKPKGLRISPKTPGGDELRMLLAGFDPHYCCRRYPGQLRQVFLTKELADSRLS